VLAPIAVAERRGHEMARLALNRLRPRGAPTVKTRGTFPPDEEQDAQYYWRVNGWDIYYYLNPWEGALFSWTSPQGEYFSLSRSGRRWYAAAGNVQEDIVAEWPLPRRRDRRRPSPPEPSRPAAEISRQAAPAETGECMDVPDQERAQAVLDVVRELRFHNTARLRALAAVLAMDRGEN